MKRKKDNSEHTENAANPPPACSADRSYETLNPGFLATVPVQVVASIAAALPGPLSSVERMRKAYELLDIGSFCRKILNKEIHQRSYDHALFLFELQSDLLRHRRDPFHLSFLEAQKNILPKDWEYYDTEQLIALQYNLQVVMNGIFVRKFPKAKRPQIFISFLKEHRQFHGLAQDWKSKSVSLKDFQQIWFDFQEWRAHQKHAAKVRAGKAKKSPPKGKQGRVRSAKDKRLGARLPKIS